MGKLRRVARAVATRVRRFLLHRQPRGVWPMRLYGHVVGTCLLFVVDTREVDSIDTLLTTIRATFQNVYDMTTKFTVYTVPIPYFQIQSHEYKAIEARDPETLSRYLRPELVLDDHDPHKTVGDYIRHGTIHKQLLVQLLVQLTAEGYAECEAQSEALARKRVRDALADLRHELAYIPSTHATRAALETLREVAYASPSLLTASASTTRQLQPPTRTTSLCPWLLSWFGYGSD